jgi:hypothetical protein
MIHDANSYSRRAREMKKTSLSTLLILALGLAMLSACGGDSSSAPLPSQPTMAVLTLSTTGSIPDGTSVNSYEVTITLPDGVTVKASPDNVNPAKLVTNPGVVTAAGTASGALISGDYTPATDTSPGTVKVYVASANGFDPGVFCKVKCNLAAGHSPKASDFTPLTLDDATGIDASLSTVILTGQLSLTATAVLQ